MKNILKYILLLHFVILQLHSNAQITKADVTGLLVDEAQQPLNGASVFLLNANDSSLEKTAISNVKGKYLFKQVPLGNYIIRIVFSGYYTNHSSQFNVAGSKTIDIPTIVFEKSTVELQKVTVVSEKPFVEQKLDRTVINVENSIISAGTSAYQVLEKSPGVTVNEEGRITLNGKQGPLILVDGKPTYLSATDLMNMLRNMPASELGKIELMSNAPAKYEAEGNAGVINFQTKKNTAIGFNGRLNAGYTQGRYPKLNSGVNLNWRKEKFNLFGNYNYFYNEMFFAFSVIRKFRNNNTITNVFDQSSSLKMQSNNQSYRLGIDFFPSKNNTVGILVNGISNDNSNIGFTGNNILASDLKLDSSAQTQSYKKGRWNNLVINTNYKHNFKREGNELTADLDYIRFNTGSNESFITNYYNKSGQLSGLPYQVRTDLPGKLDIWSAKTDYSLPLPCKGKLEAGIKISYVENDNNFLFYRTENGVERIDTNQSNHFIYKESIQAGYVIYTKEFKKSSFQIGLRGENTIGKGLQVVNNKSFNRNYFQLFPSIFYNAELSAKHTIGFSYSRRLSRPSYQDLNPFRSYHDPYTYSEGNPFLQPQFSNNIEFTHTLNKKITTRLYYTHTTDIMQNAINQDDGTRVTFLRRENLDKMDEYGITFNIGFKPAKWWNGNFFFNGYERSYSGIYLGTFFNNKAAAFSLSASNSFKLGNGYTAEISGFANSKRTAGLFIDVASYAISAGIQKTFWNNNATIRINVNDITWGMKGGSAIQFKNIDFASVVRWDNRTAAIAFSFRFGKATVKAARQRNSGAEDEKERVSTGN